MTDQNQPSRKDEARSQPPARPFDDLADVYEAMIDWPKRLANEGPFYRSVVDSLTATTVLDTACGTGHHAAMLHRWGLGVEAADISPAMIERARAAFGQPDGLRWVVRGFDEPVGSGNTFDVVLCVGNSLALASDARALARAIRHMLDAVRDGGALIVHVLNLWRLPDGPCVWQKCKRVVLPRGDVLILKGVHRSADRGHVDLVLADPAGGPPLCTESVPFQGIEAARLEALTRQAGAARVEFFGGYQQQPYDRATSVDLIMVAEKIHG